MEDIAKDISLSKVLYAVLNTVGEVRVPALNLLEDDGKEKGFIMEYDETDSSFIFRIGKSNG